MAGSDPLEPLRKAVEQSPDNAGLRRHYAQSLLKAERGPQAERQFRQVLRLEPADVDASFGLAESFLLQGEYSAALVVLEGITASPRHAEAELLLAKVHLERGDLDEATTAYRHAVEEKPELADRGLATRIGIGEYRDRDPFDDDDEDDGLDDLFGEDSLPGIVESPSDPPEIVRSELKLADVIGHERIVRRLHLHGDLGEASRKVRDAYGSRLGGGMLLAGPPGCGKTYLARAVAGERDSGIVSINLAEMVQNWNGSVEDRLHRLFEIARQRQPSVLFIDEVDAIALRREETRTLTERSLAKQLLTELDGVRADNDGLFVLAATNAPWLIDDAFLRPGRLGDIQFVGPPNVRDRDRLLRRLLRDVPSDDVKINDLAKGLYRFSHAEIVGLVATAIESAAAYAVEIGRVVELTTDMIETVASRMVPAAPAWFSRIESYGERFHMLTQDR